MFHSKQDVDRHVVEIFRNIGSEHQRNLKCYQIAKFYYKFKDYKSAIKYINRYILTTTNSAPAYRLLGECYLGINLKVKALHAFKTSLEFNGSQHDLVLKICTLLMDPEVFSVTPRANYWLDRAESLFPTNPVVFQLREHILKSNLDGRQDNGQLEKLILSEVKARPTDVTVRIRLLNFFLESKRYKIAYQHALDIEERNTFSDYSIWYDCLCNVVQAYEKANSDLGFQFFLKKMFFLERRADLFLQEYKDEVKTLSECSNALFVFDQHLHLFSKILVPQEDTHFFKEALKHLACQLSFHLATLALKRAKKEYGIWPKALRTATPLLLQATQTTMDLDDAWYNTWNGKNKGDTEVKNWSKKSTLRVSQAGHILHVWSQNKGSKFLEKISQFCGGKWQNIVYHDIFYNKEHIQATATSHFINDPFFSFVPMRLLTDAELKNFDEAAQTTYPDSLHHLVWLGLTNCDANGQLSHEFRCMTVPKLQFTVDNLAQSGPETLNQLDVDAFLYASVLCGKLASTTVVSGDRPTILPVSISEELCTPAQADWWVAVHKTYTNQSNENLEKISEMRLKLRRGIETIRAVGQHGLDVKLLVMLAKLFQDRAAGGKNATETKGLEDRAYWYWTVAITMLEKVEKNQRLRGVPNRLFDYRGPELTPSEIRGHLEEGRLFLACRLMKQGLSEEAIEAFQQLKSPYATYYQGVIYEKLASEEVNHRPESITSENRSQHIILLTRARDAFYLTLDRLRCPSVDLNHPLNSQLQDHLEEIEKQLAGIDPDNSLNKNGDTESDETDVVPHRISPDIDDNISPGQNIYNTSNFLNIKNTGTPRTVRQNVSEKRTLRFEARPSPERLDAQLRHLVQANSSGLQAIIEQLKELKSTMQIELKDLGCVTRDLLAEMRRYNEKMETTYRQREMDTIKPEELFNLAEEDYEELNQLSQPYSPYQNYLVNRPISGAQVTPSASYGASIPSASSAIQPVDNSLIPPSFYPGHQMDPSVLMYQGLRYYQGLPFGENNVPDYRGAGVQKELRKKGVLKGTGKNGFIVASDGIVTAAAPVSVSSIVTTGGVFVTKTQPPNVVITSSDVLPAFTSSGTPALSVTIPPQHIRCSTPSSTSQKVSAVQTHPFQINMPPQAQFVNESPTGKLNSLAPATSVSTSIVQKPHNLSLEKVAPTQLFTSAYSSPEQSNETAETSKLTNSQIEINQVAEVKYDKDPTLKVETKLFESDAEVHIQENKEWKEQGRFKIKLIHDKEKVKIMLFRDPLKLSSIYIVTAQTVLDSLKNSDIGWVLSVNKFSNLNLKEKDSIDEKTVWPKTCLKFNNKIEATNFQSAFSEGFSLLNIKNASAQQKSNLFNVPTRKCETCEKLFDGYNDKCGACNEKKVSDEKTNFGGFTFSSSPIIQQPAAKEDEKEKPKEGPKTHPFASFSLSSTSPKTSDSSSSNKPQAPYFQSSGTVSDLFSSVKVDPGAFKKDANFKGFDGQNSLVFSHLNKPKARTMQTANDSACNDNDEDGDDEFVPTVEFSPVVDLPDLVDMKTGEENDAVLFDERAKLLRFAQKQWKERGVGNIKLLHNQESGRVRLIMRREVILKVCCNHYLDESMEFTPLKLCNRALSWCAQDYSEGDLKPEFFALKFKDVELMNKFLDIIKKTQAKMKNGKIEGQGNAPIQKPAETKPLSEVFKPKAGSWECDKCMVRNDENSVKCACCEAPKPGTKEDTKAQPAVKQLGKGITFPPTTMTFNFGIPPQSSVSTSVTQQTPSTTTVASMAFSFGIPTTKTSVPAASTPGDKFVFGTANSTPTFNCGMPQNNVTSTSGSTPDFSFGVSKGGTNPNATTSALSIFSFGTSQRKDTATAPLFGSTSLGSDPNSAVTKNVTNIFGGSTLTKPDDKHPSFSFNLCTGNKSKIEPSSNTFSFGQALKLNEKDKFEFTFNNTLSISKPEANKSPQADTSGECENSDESDGEVDQDNGDHLTIESSNIESVIPLRDKIELNTGEEDENLAYEQRAKLFRFINKEWRERGIGEIKILKHKTNNKIRLLMRREAVLKVCLNHYVTSDIVFTRKDEKTWQWCAPDYSEGDVQYETFAIRFKTPEIASEFMETLQAVKNNVESPLKKTEPEAKESTETMKSFSFAFPTPTSSTQPIVGVCQSRESSQDISIVYENQVTPELREKATALGLPPNFYSYLQLPDCPGCRGCEKDDIDANTQGKAPSSIKTSPPMFGSIQPFNLWAAQTLNSAPGTNKQKCVFSFSGNKATANQMSDELKNVGFIIKKEEDDCDGGDEEEEDDEDEGENDDYQDSDECEQEAEEENDENEENEKNYDYDDDDDCDDDAK